MRATNQSLKDNKDLEGLGIFSDLEDWSSMIVHVYFIKLILYRLITETVTSE